MRLKKETGKEKKRKAIMQQVNEATRQGQCVILAETKAGTRIIVCGKDNMTRQLEQIAKEQEVRL